MCTHGRTFVLLLALTALAADKKTQRTDLYGEPLPQGAIARLGRGDFPRLVAAGAFAFSPDGKQLATANKDGTVRLWDAATGKETRRLRGLPEEAIALAYSPDGKVLAAAGRERSIWTWNPIDGKEIGGFDFDRRSCPVYAVDVAAEGKWLMASGYGGVQVWNTVTRKKSSHGSPALSSIFAVALSSNDKYLAEAALDGSIQVRGLENERGGGFSPTSNKEVLSVAFSPDGNTMATAGVDGLRLWETRSGREKRRLIWNQDQRVRTVAFSPDGGLLASGEDGGLVRVWKMPRGREKQRMKILKNSIIALGFLDRRILAAGDEVGMARIWDITQGRANRSFGKPERFVQGLAISPDKKILATTNVDDSVIRIWNAATGQLQFHFQGKKGGIHTAAFVPRGAFLATVGNKDHTVRLWDVTTGRERANFPNLSYGSSAVDFSPDGKLLAFVGEEGIQLLELATGKERIHFAGSLGESVNGFAFSADGKMLASAGTDSTASIWDVTGRCPDGRWQTQEMTAAQVQSHWRMLAGNDAAAAHRAIWALAAAPRQTASFIQKQLQPVARKDTKHLPALLADLDSADFAVREKATHGLKEMGEAAEPALRKVLASKPSLELRRRVEPMVKDLENWPASSSTTLRAWRALEVLEHLGTPEARRLLRRLADGAPEARLTREAKAALQRLAARQTPKP